MKNFLICLFSLSCMFFSAVAQNNAGTNSTTDYENAIGIKVYPFAISAKHFIANDKAVEGLAYFGNDGFRVSGLYEFYGDITGIDGLKWYAGPGAHIGFWSTSWENKNPTRNQSIAIGIDGVFGLDYKIKDVPVNVSLDWQPSFNFIGYNYFEGGWGGIGVRYTF